MNNRKIQSIELSERIGRNIVSRRKNLGINQERMAFMCGIQKGYMSEIESGKKLPSLDVLINVAESFEIDVKDLFEYEHFTQG